MSTESSCRWTGGYSVGFSGMGAEKTGKATA